VFSSFCLSSSFVCAHAPPTLFMAPILLLLVSLAFVPTCPFLSVTPNASPFVLPFFSLSASAFPAITLQAAQTPHKFSAWKHTCSPGTDPCAHAHIHTQHSKRRNNWHQKQDHRLEGSLEGLFHAAVRDWRVRIIAATFTVGTSTF